MAVVISGPWVGVVAAFVRGALAADVVSSMASCVMAAAVIGSGAMAASATVAPGMSSRLANGGQ